MDTTITALLTQIKTATGWSEPKLASELGTSQPTINRILNGQTECKGSTLRAIEALHRKVAAPTKTAAPKPPTRPRQKEAK